MLRFIIRPHHMHAVRKMRPIATHVARSVVCLSVCLCVGHTDVTVSQAHSDSFEFICAIQITLMYVCMYVSCKNF